MGHADRTRIAAIALFVTLAMLAAMLLTTGGRFAFPLDDPYIYFQYACQNAHGEWFRYNDGDPATTGATSLLYTLLLTPFALVLKGTMLAVVAFAGAAVLFFLTLASVRRIAADWIGNHAAWPATWLVALGGPFLWGMFSGMETPLVAFLTVRLAEEYLRYGRQRSDGEPTDAAPWSRRRFVVFGVLLALSRPEAALVILLLLLTTFMFRRGFGELGVIGVGLPLFAALAPFAVNLVLTGSAGSMTLASKGAPYLPGMTPGTWLIETTQFLLHNLKGLFASGDATAPAWPSAYTTLVAFAAPLTLFFAVLGALPACAIERRAGRPGFGWAASLILAGVLVFWAATVPINLHWNRYILPFLPLLTLLVVAGVSRLSDAFAKTELRRAVRGGLIGFFLLCAIPVALHFTAVYGWNCGEIGAQHITLARWIRENTPPNSVIGTNDVGAIRYYGGRPVLDLHGLTSRELAACKQVGSGAIYEHLEALPEEKRPDFMAVLPGWYEPAFLHLHRPIRSQTLRKAMIAGSPLVLYAANWQLAHSGQLPGREIREMTQGLVLVDQLDVADLRSETKHAYRLHLVPGESAGPIGIMPSPGGGGPVVDGGRLVTGREAMTVGGLRPGRDAIVAMRALGDLAATLRVDGGPPIAVRGRAPEGDAQWTEVAVPIPGNQILSATPRIVVTAIDGAYREGGYTSFHYWFYQ